VEEFDADVNDANLEGYTSLQMSAMKGDLAMVKELGADVH
jgi:ankyrin repeat protein